eukprot:TRINITY_DN1682_c0_g1_i1.p1 TRINITY_DN1682_c0_g1~~TRINITY_DN1682_c0_g1_i1.p1  ORF type:complete len:163 (-),score=36.83 TRINITY_DN1682_c0_g1_i1:7-495(-)
MKIFVEVLPNCKQFCVAGLTGEETGLTLKQRIESIKGVPTRMQLLTLNSSPIQDERKLSDYLISSHSTLQLRFVEHMESPNFVVYVETSSGQILKVEGIYPESTIFELKLQLKCQINQAPKEQCLMFKGTLLEDDCMLSQYEIQREDTLALQDLSSNSYYYN